MYTPEDREVSGVWFYYQEELSSSFLNNKGLQKCVEGRYSLHMKDQPTVGRTRYTERDGPHRPFVFTTDNSELSPKFSIMWEEGVGEEFPEWGFIYNEKVEGRVLFFRTPRLYLVSSPVESKVQYFGLSVETTSFGGTRPTTNDSVILNETLLTIKFFSWMVFKHRVWYEWLFFNWNEGNFIFCCHYGN